MTEILGASLGLQSGVSPSRVSAGLARRFRWSGLSVDVLLDDRQRCATAGDGEVGRRPEVAAHAGADTRSGELAPDRLSGAAFEALGKNRNRQCGWIRDEQMHVVASPLNSTNSALSSAHTVRMLCSVNVTMASVNTRRRCLVPNTRWECSSDTLCRLRR
jgi:hypothetical protein